MHWNKLITISSVGAGVPRESTLHTKLGVDYISLSLVIEVKLTVLETSKHCKKACSSAHYTLSLATAVIYDHKLFIASNGHRHRN
jgi:hypothetical protein